MKVSGRGQIVLSPTIKKRCSYKQQCILTFTRLIFVYAGFLLSIFLLDEKIPGLLICFAIGACYATILFISKSLKSLLTLNITSILDVILIFLVCYFSGGLNSPFLPAFLLPIVVSATRPCFIDLLRIIIVSALALLLLGITGGFNSPIFFGITITITIVGLLIYTLVYSDFQIISSYAVKDGLTGLYTHQYFYDQLNAFINDTSQPILFSLIMIDLDDFKHLNDDYGHLHGDQVLKQVAHAITTHTRDSDIIARYGGDEFAIILPGVGYKLCRAIVERLRSSIIALGYFDHVSIGAALYPDEANGIYELVDLADSRMYECKKESRRFSVRLTTKV